MPLVHPGDPKRLSDRVLAEGWVRLPAKHFHNERVYQSSSLALDSQLTPGERLRAASLQAQRTLRYGTDLQNDDAV